MVRFKNILCPVDFFPASLRAFDYAVTIAKHYGAKLHALHVVVPQIGAAHYSTLGVQEMTAELEQVSVRHLEELKTRWIKSGVPVTTSVRVGEIDSEIRRSVEMQKADLVVMGTHGRKGFEHLVLGSVSEHMIRHCPVPLISVGVAKRKASAPPKFHRILVTTDFSDGTTDAMNHALSIAQECQSKVTLLHVIPDITADLVGTYRDCLIRGVNSELELLIPKSALDWCEVETRVETGLPFRVIPNILKSGNFDLLVMNIHSKSLLDRISAGSTAERTVRTAAGICPILLVPPLNKRKDRRSR